MVAKIKYYVRVLLVGRFDKIPRTSRPVLQLWDKAQSSFLKKERNSSLGRIGERAVGEQNFFRHTYALRNYKWRMTGLTTKIDPGRRIEEEDGGWRMWLFSFRKGRRRINSRWQPQNWRITAPEDPRRQEAQGKWNSWVIPRVRIICFSLTISWWWWI